MTLNLKSPEFQPREQRLGSITGYEGTLKDMAQRGCGGCLTNRRRCFTTVSSCTHFHCLSLLINIEDSVIVDHAPSGCSSGIIHFSANRVASGRLGPDKHHARVFCTNIQERETVFGALDKLRDTIRAAYERYHPKIIYVSTSCTSSIIGDDVYSVVQEMREELGVTISFAAVEGIKSKIWASGFDAYGHAVVDSVIKPPAAKKNQVNYIAFAPIGREEVDRLFGRLGYEVLYLTGLTNNEEYARASQSVATFGQCGAQSSYLAGALEQLYGIKYFQSYLPYGGLGFERFLREIGPHLGKADLAEQIIAEEREKYREELESLRGRLRGKTAVILLGASYAYEYVRILRELGVTVLHAVGYHYDPRLDNQSDDPVAAAADARDFEDIPTSVNDIQTMENYLVIKRLQPDFVVSRAHGDGCWAVKMGIPDIEGRIGLQVFGYKGLVSFGRVIADELDNLNFVKKMHAHFEPPFTEEYEGFDPYFSLEDDAEEAI
ncbi:nitrogenase component 1 [Desulfitobacterium chlororespirans]|uniref:Nitrogenase molybdenum-iron protein alpha chain n=1 Tax=Desulfitobacterium chlororespirans DSM 11544 TaxID=1121395 RepID=A0A1M7RYR4_9FIRM|nr:nitrogenase component 1 [Desulfitobacterium chlororespirans]SHN51182.1 nitrogenase molybdenum-iron protein alpha chain [Desulfitobacterium chlororespirans DSM 11544]